MKQLKSVILAGGEGSRLRPITCDIPKPLAPICGIPCLYYILNLLKTHGSSEAVLTLGYKSKDIEQAVKNIREMTLHCVTENKPLGTSGSVLSCKKFIDGDFFVICGDCICDFNLTEALAFHRKHGGPATVILTKVKEPLEYGVAVMNDCGRIIRFEEKPSWSRAYSNTVNTGVYLFSEKIFEFIPQDEPSDFSKDVFPKLLNNDIPIYGYVENGYWCDIGSVEAYINCNKDMLSGKIKTIPSLSVLTDKTAEKPEGITVEEPVYIGRNVKAKSVSARKFSIIGDNCVLGKNIRIENSILFDGVTMEDGSTARGCVICSNATLKQNASVGEMSVIGATAEIGKNSTVCAGSKIYPKNVIPEYKFVKETVFEGINEITIEHGRIRFKSPENDISVSAKIGEAFASVAKNGTAVGINENSDKKRLTAHVLALYGGLISAEENTFDLGQCDINIFSEAVREHGFGGGIFISEEKGILVFTLLESDGLPFRRETERKFESFFSSGETNRVRNGKIGKFGGYERIYEKKLTDRIKKTYSLKATVSGPKFITNKFVSEPKKNNYEYIYVMPERLVVQTAGKEAYDEDLIKCVVAFCTGITDGEVFVPYDYPAVLDIVAKEYGFSCIRLTSEDSDRIKLHKMTDTYAKTLSLLEYMAKNELTFEEIAKKIPVFTSRRRETESSANKAEVMNMLSHGTNRELKDGIKIKEKKGTVHIVPQKTRNAFIVKAEAADAETAAELCDFYVKKLKK